MDIFRTKKRDVEQASLESRQGLKKKRQGLYGSLDDLLDIGKDSDEFLTHLSETTASESEDDENDINKASKKQKALAKMTIRRDKRKEKEQQKKTERNLISMDDFLGKQTEFKMWLYEEKSKNAGDLSSPKLKAHFKQFVRLWNKKKLAAKYYRCSNLPESPGPLTPRRGNFMSSEGMQSSSPLLEGTEHGLLERETPTSPFVTFGKTPPKVFRSKMFQLFGPSKDIALLSVAPIGSPQVVKDVQNKGFHEEYQVPRIARSTDVSSEDTDGIPKRATPYKVSVYPWATKEVDISIGSSQDLNTCQIETPPRRENAASVSDEDLWPAPPTESELLLANTHDSPHIPPPPPPRLESLQKSDCVTKSPKLAGNYADPYDTVETQSNDTPSRSTTADYQDPVDCVPAVNQRTISDNARLVLQSLSQNDEQEPDLSLYCKPVSEKRLSKEELEELYAKPLKKAKRNDIGSLFNEDNHNNMQQNEEEKTVQSDLYSEIMEHINKNKNKPFQKIESGYASIDECMSGACKEEKTEKINFSPVPIENLKRKNDTNTEAESSGAKFATISKSKKMRVMAASTEKIYETYLSLGRRGNPVKMPKPSTEFKSNTLGQSLKAKCKSQPDISFNEGIQEFTINFESDRDCHNSAASDLSSFKPTRKDSKNFAMEKLTSSDRAKSFEDGLREIPNPQTPTIMATPSFDSLCDVTPLSYRSPSSQSLPHSKSGSYESLSSHMSISTSSSLSFGPDEKSGSLQSLQSERSLFPVKEEVETKPDSEPVRRSENGSELSEKYEFFHDVHNSHKKEFEVRKEAKQVDEGSDKEKDNQDVSNDVYKTANIPLTPGKISALKHGIDLSVYLLKPTKTDEADLNKNTENLVSSETGLEKSAPKPSESQKLFDNQSRLVIKETLSGVKTKPDQTGRSAARKEMERRHTVQTMQEFERKTSESRNLGSTGPQEPKTLPIPRSKRSKRTQNGDVTGQEPVGKKLYAEGRRQLNGDEHYLETDLDKVLTDKPQKTLRKSKSHSGFETSTGTVVTEIW